MKELHASRRSDGWPSFLDFSSFALFFTNFLSSQVRSELHRGSTSPWRKHESQDSNQFHVFDLLHGIKY